MSTIREVLHATMIGVALSLCADAALAQQPTDAQKNAIRNNCRSDYMANCSSVTPGGIEALQCLQHNSAKLSSACRGAVAAITPREAPPAAAPAQSPVAAPPPAPAAGPAAAPVRPAGAPRPSTHAAVPPTESAPSRPRQPSGAERAAIRQACQADFMSRCAGVQPGGAQALQCLQGHAPELSAGCRSALAAIGGAAAASTVAVALPPPVIEQPIGPIGPLPVRFRLEILNICRAEQAQFCSGVPAGGGRLIDCLVANQASISPGCRRALVWASR